MVKVTILHGILFTHSIKKIAKIKYNLIFSVNTKIKVSARII